MGRASREEQALAGLLAEALDELERGEADARSIAERTRAQDEILPLLEIAEALRKRRAAVPPRAEWLRARAVRRSPRQGRPIRLKRRLA